MKNKLIEHKETETEGKFLITFFRCVLYSLLMLTVMVLTLFVAVFVFSFAVKLIEQLISSSGNRSPFRTDILIMLSFVYLPAFYIATVVSLKLSHFFTSIGGEETKIEKMSLLSVGIVTIALCALLVISIVIIVIIYPKEASEDLFNPFCLYFMCMVSGGVIVAKSLDIKTPKIKKSALVVVCTSIVLICIVLAFGLFITFVQNRDKNTSTNAKIETQKITEKTKIETQEITEKTKIENPDETVYISPQSFRYHFSADCLQIKFDNGINEIKIIDAEEKGYTPCPKCKP